MAELNELCKLIFQTEHQHEQFYDITDYIQKLGSHKWEDIKKEPERLREEMQHLTEQTQELAFTNYKTFVETADISRTIMKDLGRSKDTLNKFVDTMPSFIQESEKFSEIAGNIIKEKSRYSNIGSHSDKLLELLELPSLMREALNADDYDSALDIFTFVRNMSSRYSDIPVVQNTSSDIMALWFETLYHLFNQLRYDLPLPQCLQVLGYLRRASTVYKSTEDRGGEELPGGDGLHLHFLKARNAWFENALEEAQNTECAERVVRRVLELHRLHLFSVLTQHRSIFLECGPRDHDLSGSTALSCWLKLKVEALRGSVRSGLELADDAGLEALHHQCMYLALSFARVGADLRAVLAPELRARVLALLHAGLRATDGTLDAQLRAYSVPAVKQPARPPADPTHAGPPESLLDFYPLAEYCNGLLTILNCLRVTAPLDIVKEVYDAFRESLRSAVCVLTQVYRRERQAFTDTERHNFLLCCACFAEDLAPFVARCLARWLPGAAVAEHLGVSLSTLQEAGLLQLHVPDICQPLMEITRV